MYLPVFSKLKKLARIWYMDWTPEPELHGRISALATAGAAERAGLLSYLIAVAFAFYGFTSINFINRFDPHITLWNNLWPRLCLNVVPLVLLGRFLTSTHGSPRLRIAGWMLGYPLVVHAASWVNVWPIALAGQPEILLYVHGPNAWIVAIMFMTIAPPNKHILLFSLAFLVIFICPLAIVTYLSNRSHTFFAQTCVIDLTHSLVLNTVAASIISRLRVKLITIEIMQKKEASKFLGKTVSKAIFENRGDLLASRTVQAFGMMMDIRASTELGQSHAGQMKLFIDAFDALVPRIIGKYGGTTNKSLGDGYLATFGALDDLDTLSGLGFDAELVEATKRRNQILLANLCKAYAELITEVHAASTEIFGYNMIALGAGIDFGAIEIKIKGDDEHRKEFDLAGPIIARCSRLEEYSKLFRPKFAPLSSLLLLSPEASAFLCEQDGFDQVGTERPVRNFPEIKWVTIKGYSYQPPQGLRLAS